MSLRRLISIVGVSAVAASSLVAAAPDKKKPAPKKPATPVAPAKEEAPAAPAGGAGGSASGSSSAGGDASGSAVQPIEDTPPADMNGTTENPDNPHALPGEEVKTVVAAPVKKDPYPIQEVLRPLVLARNMAEVSIAPYLEVSPFYASDAVHARYGITERVQIGVTYTYMGVYDRSIVTPGTSKKTSFHSGKAFGIDATVLIQDWLAVRVGVPFYIDPVAVGLQIGAPIKFVFADKFALGGLDDLLNIRLSKFAPNLNNEFENQVAAARDATNTQQSNGHLRFSFYGEYQYDDHTAFIGRIGIDTDLGATSGGGGAGTDTVSGTQTFIRAGIQYSPKRWFDIGGSIGFDDLSRAGSFGPQLNLALRI